MPNNDRFQIQPPQPEEEQLQGPQLGGFLPFLGRQAVRGVSRAVTSPFEFLEALGGIGTSLGERAESAAQQLTGLKPTEIEQEQIPMGITLPKLFGLTPKQPSDISPITAFSKIAQEVGRLGQKPFEKAKEVLPEGYLDPQNLGERIFDRVASAAPILAAAAISGGGAFLTPFLHGLGREALSATTGESIKSLGGGPVAEFFGSLGSALGYDYLRGIQPQNITNYLRDKQTQRYQASKEVGKNLTVDTNVLRNELKEVSRDLTSTAPGVARKRIPAIEKELEIIQDISKGDAVNINKLVNQKQHINSLYDQETDANVKKYFARMAEDLQDAIQSSGNPEFLRDFNKAEDITRVLSQVNDSGDLISRVTRKLGNSIKSTALKTILNIPNFILSDVVTPEFPLLKLPDTRHYLRNIVTNSLLGKTGAVARNIKGLDKVLQKEEKKPSRFKVRPGKPENQRFTVRPPSS